MVKTIQVNGDQVILGKNGVSLVSSASEPGSWHSVKAGVCDCRGYQFRGHCRHARAVIAAGLRPTPVENGTFALYAQTIASRH